MDSAAASSQAFLIVEDDAFAARTFVALIRPSGFARSVSTVKQALVAIGQRAWTGLVLDVTLPDGSGLDLLERLRAEGHVLPALVVTGSHDAMVANRAHRLGASCVFKPDVAADLQMFVQRAITATTDAHSRRLAAVRSLRKRLNLSSRELDIVELLALGVPRERLAEELNLSENTIKSTVRRILAKFQETSVEGVARAIYEEVVRLSSATDP